MSNYSSTSNKTDNDSTNRVKNAQGLINDEGNGSRYEYADALENNRNKQAVNAGKLYETELKKHLFNIERKLEFLCKV